MKGGPQALLSPRALTPALPSPGCSCDPRGTLGGVTECQLVSHCQGIGFGSVGLKSCLYQVSLSVPFQGNGQCFCKAHVCGQACAACKDGFFGLDHADYFGCRGKCSPTAGPQTLSMLYHAMHSGRLKPREVQMGQAGRGLCLTTLPTARGSDIQLAPWPALSWR